MKELDNQPSWDTIALLERAKNHILSGVLERDEVWEKPYEDATRILSIAQDKLRRLLSRRG